MDFGEALKELRDGKRITRCIPGVFGMWLILVPGSTITVTADRPLGKAAPELVGRELEYQPHIDIKNADGEIAPWVPSQQDLLADDWRVA